MPFFHNSNPTKISIDFSVKDIIYSYTLSYDAQKIHFEELLDEEDEVIFSRELNIENNGYDYDIPKPELILSADQLDVADGLLKQIKLSTSEKRPFLRQLVENNCKKLETVLLCIRNVIIRLNPYGFIGKPLYAEQDLHSAAGYFKEAHIEENVVHAMNSIGVNLLNLEVTYSNNDPMPGERVNTVRKITSQYNINDKKHELDFMTDESDGTVKFYSYLALVYFIIQHNGILVVDELETHFHPLLVEEIIKAVHQSNSKAQLIFTTHNAMLLNDSLFERDQIYFTEKNKNQSTELYSLADFTDLKNDDNIQAKYLTGNFGAIPYLNSLNFESIKNG